MESIITWVLVEFGACGVIIALLIFYIVKCEKDIRSILSDLRAERSYSRQLNTLLTSGREKMATLVEKVAAIERRL